MAVETHPSLQDLTRAAYDLAPSPDHVFWCGSCLEILERMREERDAFRRENPLREADRGFFARLLQPKRPSRA